MEKKDYDLFQQNWESYAGNRTVNSVGLKNGIEIMFEYALLGKDGHQWVHVYIDDDSNNNY